MNRYFQKKTIFQEHLSVVKGILDMDKLRDVWRHLYLKLSMKNFSYF